MMIFDGLKSLIGRLGDPTRDKGASLYFSRNEMTDDQLGAAFEANWVSRKLVTIPAEDALREWRTWRGEAREAIEAEEERLGLRQKVLEAKIKARLYGGAGIYFGTNQDPAEPFRAESVGKGGLKYATVLTRQELTVDDIERNPLAENYGRPTMYRINSSTGNMASIHPSRMAMFRGDMRADSWKTGGMDRGWDLSVLIAAAQAIKEFSGTTANVASLLFEANVDVIGIPDLSTKLATPSGESALQQRFALVSANKSINQSIIMDAEETYERKGASFADLTPTMESFALFVAAAASIPATRFLSRSPTGMNATGGHDAKNYEDMLRSIQTLDIGPGMRNLDRALPRSAGAAADEGYDWNPLEREDRKELSEIGKATAETLLMLGDLGITGDALRELTVHRMAEIGVFPHIEDVTAKQMAALELEPMEELDDEPEEDDPE